MNDVCIRCGRHEVHAKKLCSRCYEIQWRAANRDDQNEKKRERRHKCGALPMSKNKECSSFLGVHVAENVLNHVYKTATMMPYGNRGYDFVCGHGMKIDVKSAVITYHGRSHGKWIFPFKRNTIADYFLCIAFDDRKNLNPLHLWLVPGHVVNWSTGICVSVSTVKKWDAYKLDLSKVVECCDGMKGGAM